jgi:hypothetical protein
MSRAARRRRWRIVVAVSTAFALAVGLVVAISVAGGAPRAAANPSGQSPEVFVTGTGGADHFTLSSVGPTPVNNAPSGVVGPVAINVTATKALVGVAIPGAAAHLDLISDNTDTGSSSALRGPVIGIAMDPTNPNLAYAVVSAGEIYSVDISNPTPVPSLLTVSARFQPNSLAISPNGQTLYLGWGNGDGTCGLDAVPISSPNTPTTIYNCPSQEGSNVVDVAVSPGGDQVLGAVQLFTTSVVVALSSNPLKSWTQPLSGEEPTTLTVGPDGNTVYVGMIDISTGGGGGSRIQARRAIQDGPAHPGGELLGSTPVPIPTNPNRQGGVTGIAVSPDGGTLIAAGDIFNTTGAAQTRVVPVNLQLPLTPKPFTVVPGLSTTGSEDVAITPDQAPVANFSAPAAVEVGQGATFDANPSLVAFGSITSFAWDFGDLTTAGPSGSPLVSHSYSKPGTYQVTLTEVDSAGTGFTPAPSPSGPGQTPHRRSGPSARTTGTITVTPGPPPTNTTSTTAPSTTTTGPGQTTTTVPGQPPPGTPTLVLNPAVGTPGTIVTVTGTGFPPNTPVTVSWTVSTGSVVIVADNNGNLPPSQLLILTPDVLGPRFAQASSTPQATAPFLVVPSTSEPGGDDAGLLFRSEGP